MSTKLSKKICLLGDFAVGKTSLMRRFVYDRFDDKYISTIGVKVSRKTIVIPHADDVTELTMMLWDLAGSEEFSQIRASYLRGTAGAILVCDLTRAETLDSLSGYTDSLYQVNPDAKCVLVANKNDLLDQHRLITSQVEAVAAKLNIPAFFSSAKTGVEVETLFRRLGLSLLMS